MIILVDTREQRPYKWNQVYVKKKLNVGDYSTVKLLDSYHIERKSLQDLYGTLTKGHYRFKKELLRAKHNNIRLVVVVEGTRKNFIAKNFPFGKDRKFPGEGLDKMVRTIQRKYKLTIYWCSTRSRAKQKTFNLLKYEERRKKT